MSSTILHFRKVPEVLKKTAFTQSMNILMKLLRLHGDVELRNHLLLVDEETGYETYLGPQLLIPDQRLIVIKHTDDNFTKVSLKKDAQIDETSSESDMDDDADADDKVVDLVVTTNAIEDSTPLPIDDLDSDDGNDSERILNTYACLFNLNTFASGSDGGVEAGRSEEEVSTVNFSQPVPTVHASAGSSPLPTLASIHGGSVAPSSYAELPPKKGHL